MRSLAILAGILLPCWLLTAEVICFEQMRLKPLHCVCGKFTDMLNEPVAAVTVIAFRDGKEVARTTSGQDGRFRFEVLKPGSYELRADPLGYREFRCPIVVSTPGTKCKRRLTIFLDASGLESCGSRVVKQ